MDSSESTPSIQLVGSSHLTSHVLPPRHPTHQQPRKSPAVPQSSWGRLDHSSEVLLTEPLSPGRSDLTLQLCKAASIGVGNSPFKSRLQAFA